MIDKNIEELITEAVDTVSEKIKPRDILTGKIGFWKGIKVKVADVLKDKIVIIPVEGDLKDWVINVSNDKLDKFFGVKLEDFRPTGSGTGYTEVPDLMLKHGKGEKGILVKISGMDATNNGVTSGEKQAILLVDDGNLTARGDIPILEIVPGRGGREFIAIPVGSNTGRLSALGPMFGGQFIFSNDSRFPSDQPIHVHDRFETQSQYDALSY